MSHDPRKKPERDIVTVIDAVCALVPELVSVFAVQRRECEADGFRAPENRPSTRERWLTANGTLYGAMAVLEARGRVTHELSDRVRRVWNGTSEGA